jgi:hypothetical protein
MRRLFRLAWAWLGYHLIERSRLLDQPRPPLPDRG